MTGESVLHIPLQTLHDEVINVDKTRVNQSYTYRYRHYMTGESVLHIPLLTLHDEVTDNQSYTYRY